MSHTGGSAALTLGVNWINLSESATYFGVSTPNLKVNGTVRTMSGDLFRVIVSGTCIPPVTSAEVLLTVNTAPQILSQPVAASICENTNTSFTVTAQGTAITYQWFVDPATGTFEPVTNTGSIHRCNNQYAYTDKCAKDV